VNAFSPFAIDAESDAAILLLSFELLQALKVAREKNIATGKTKKRFFIVV
jgi:hypothetical protein